MGNLHPTLTARPGIHVVEAQSPLVWKHGKDVTIHYFTDLRAVFTDKYQYSVKIVKDYVLWLSPRVPNETPETMESFCGVGLTLKDAYRDAYRTYRIEMNRRDEEARVINHREMWGKDAWY